MTDPIILPVIFDDGSKKDISVSAKDNRYLISIGHEPAGEMIFSADRNQ